MEQADRMLLEQVVAREGLSRMYEQYPDDLRIAAADAWRFAAALNPALAPDDAPWQPDPGRES